MLIGKLKSILEITGIGTAAVGLLCLPVGFGVSPRRDLSAFNNLADTGVFVTVAVVLLVASGIFLGVAWMLPHNREAGTLGPNGRFSGTDLGGAEQEAPLDARKDAGH